MATTADRLSLLLDTKTAIKGAINEKGVEVTDADPFSTYANKILEISGGSSGPDWKANPTAYMAIRKIGEDIGAYTYITEDTEALTYFQGTLPATEKSLLEEVHIAPYASTLPISTLANFLSSASALITLTGTENLTQLNSLGDGFLSFLPQLRTPVILPPNITTIGNNCMASMNYYAYPLEVPSTVTSIGNSFLSNCGRFNRSLVLPDSLTTIGISFMSNCTTFTQPLTIPASVQSIGTNFMNGASNFIGPLIVETPHSPTDTSSLSTYSTTASMYAVGITMDGEYADTWMANLPSRTASPYRNLISKNAQPGDYGVITYLDANDQPVEYGFKAEVEFAQLSRTSTSAPYTLNFGGTSVSSSRITAYKFGPKCTTVGDRFLYHADALQTLDFANAPITSIGNYFCSTMKSTLNAPVVFPSTLQTLGTYAFEQSLVNVPITLQGTNLTVGSRFLTSAAQFNSSLTIAEGVKSLGDYFLSYASVFNKPLTLPNSITSLGGQFLYSDTSFNSALSLPANLTAIGGSFMYGCTAFAQALTIPASVTSFGTYFMYNTNNFVGPLTAQTLSSPTDNGSLGTSSSTAVSYTTGITIDGAGSAIWGENLINRTSSPYRKLITAPMAFTPADGTPYSDDLELEPFSGGTYGRCSYIDSNGALRYYTLTSQNDIQPNGATNSTTPVVWKTLDNGETIGTANIVAWAWGTTQPSGYSNPFRYSPELRASYNFHKTSYTLVADYMFANCPKFDCDLQFPTALTKYGNHILSGCTSFNHPITFPAPTSSTVSVGQWFLGGATAFNSPVTFEGTTPVRVSTYFLHGCTSFDQPIIVPADNAGTLTPEGFLHGCSSFNSPVTFSSGITSVGPSFLYNCSAFNQPLTLPSSSSQVGANFLLGCSSFNQALSLPATITSIGDNFLLGCSSFNQFVTIPSSVTNIGSGFLGSCSSFNQPITLPATVTTPPASLLSNTRDMVSTVTLDTAPNSPANATCLSSTTVTDPSYVNGIPIAGTYAQEWMDALTNRSTGAYPRNLVLAETA